MAIIDLEFMLHLDMEYIKRLDKLCDGDLPTILIDYKLKKLNLVDIYLEENLTRIKENCRELMNTSIDKIIRE